MGKMNKIWHLLHRMPKNANLQQRITWHLEHQRQCGCREIPKKLKEEMGRRGIKIPINIPLEINNQ